MCFCSAGDDSDRGYEDSDDGDGAISGVSESGVSKLRLLPSTKQSSTSTTVVVE